MSSWFQLEFWTLVLFIFICEPNMNPQTKIVTLRTGAGFQANQGKCLGGWWRCCLLLTRLITQTFGVQDTSRA